MDKMASTKRAYLLETHEHNHRDSGNYSESCKSEISESQPHYSRTAEVESQNNKENALRRIESKGNNTPSINTEDKTVDRYSKTSALSAKSDEQKRLLSISETERDLKTSFPYCELFANIGITNGKFGDRPLSYQDSIKLDSSSNLEDEGSREALLKNRTGVDVIHRCDTLINQLQDVTQKYFALQRSYQKIKKICHLMIIVNAVLLVLCITTVVPLLVVLSRTSSEASQDRGGGNGNDLAAENKYKICFDCSDLKRGTSFLLETLLDVTEKDGTCCFKSITSVLKSLHRIFGNTLTDKTEQVKHKLFELNKRLFQIEVGLAPNASNVIGNILQVMAPKEKTAVHLLSMQDFPVSLSNDAFNKFIKLRWSSSERSTILRGNVQLSDDKLNIRVNSEAYYFFYARVSFMHKERDIYRRQTPLRYLVYRKRGSISSYIHEAKLSCVFNEISQEHSVTTELIIHLNRNDSIFVSVDDADKQLLATKTGAHSMGLFEI